MDAYKFLQKEYNIDDYYNSVVFHKKDGGFTSCLYVTSLMNEFLEFNTESIIKDFVKYAIENNFPIKNNIDFTIQKYLYDRKK